MPLFVVVLLKKTSYNKERKTKVENERRKKERSQGRDKKAITADSASDLKFHLNFLHWQFFIL